MAITKQKKGEILKKVEDILKSAGSVVFVGFKGLTVTDTTKMRKDLRAQGVGYTVAKKTLIARALASKDPAGQKPELPGEVAIAYAQDAITPAREVHAYVKKFKDNLAILGGIFEGGYKSKEEMMAIAAIPSIPVLRGMFVNVINSPIQGLVVALSGIAKKKS